MSCYVLSHLSCRINLQGGGLIHSQVRVRGGLGEAEKPAQPTSLVMAELSLNPGFSDSGPHAPLTFPAAFLTALISNRS